MLPALLMVLGESPFATPIAPEQPHEGLSVQHQQLSPPRVPTFASMEVWVSTSSNATTAWAPSLQEEGEEGGEERKERVLVQLPLCRWARQLLPAGVGAVEKMPPFHLLPMRLEHRQEWLV